LKMENVMLKPNLDSGLSNDYLLEKKFQMMVEQSVGRLKNELDAANGKIARLQEEISELKTKVNQQRFEQAVQPVQVAVPQQQVQEPPRRTEMPGRPDPKDYTDGEITIEKYFSFGKKRS